MNIGIRASSNIVIMLRNSNMLTVPRLRSSKTLLRSSSLPSITVADDNVSFVLSNSVGAIVTLKRTNELFSVAV